MYEQTLLTLEKTLKENYLPVWQNQLSIEPTPLLSKIKTVPLTANEIVSSAPIGLSGGFGFGAEGQATPSAGNVKFERFKTTAKDMYCNIAISAKAVRLGNKSGAVINALETEVKAAYETAKWNVGRALFGNGSGKLTTTVAQGASGKTIKIADAKYIKEGLIIDIYKSSDSSLVKSGVRIASVNRVADSDGNYSITLDSVPSTSALAAGFITVQNSYNREIEGLGVIFDDTITSIYGVSKTDNPYLKPIVVDASNTITDGVITGALRRAKNEKNSKVNMILCGDGAYDEYVDYLRTNNERIENSSRDLKGGFKSIGFTFGNSEVDIVNESFVPDGEMWGIDTNAVKLHIQEWNFADLQGGGIFNLMENSSIYRALLANYGNLMCENPGGCVRITNCK